MRQLVGWSVCGLWWPWCMVAIGCTIVCLLICQNFGLVFCMCANPRCVLPACWCWPEQTWKERVRGCVTCCIRRLKLIQSTPGTIAQIISNSIFCLCQNLYQSGNRWRWLCALAMAGVKSIKQSGHIALSLYDGEISLYSKLTNVLDMFERMLPRNLFFI